MGWISSREGRGSFSVVFVYGAVLVSVGPRGFSRVVARGGLIDLVGDLQAVGSLYIGAC